MIRIRGLFDSCAIIEKVMATKNTNYQLHLKGFVGGYGYVLRATSMSRVKKRSNLFGHSAFSFFIFQFLIFNLDLRSSLLTLGITQASLVDFPLRAVELNLLLSLNRSLQFSIFNLEWPVAHAARGGDSGQCCRQCCNDYTHNNLPHILLFIHSFQKLITLFFVKPLPSPLGEGFGGEASSP